MTVYSWVYHQQVGTGWKFTPSPDPNGYINLESGYHWITWTGSSCEPVTFDLGVSGVKLEKMEFAGGVQSPKFLVYKLSDDLFISNL